MALQQREGGTAGLPGEPLALRRGSAGAGGDDLVTRPLEPDTATPSTESPGRSSGLLSEYPDPTEDGQDRGERR